MEQRCQKCGASVGAEQACCPACGAVIGMNMGTTQVGGGWDLASTVVGQHAPTPSRSTGERRGSRPSRPETPPPAAPEPAPRKGNSMLLAIIGFVAVLLIGGLVILFLYLNSQG